MTATMPPATTTTALPVPTDLPEGVLCVRQGPGANCSSIGSAVHVLFATGALAALVAVVAAALADAGAKPPEHVPPEGEPREGDDGQPS